MSFTETRLPTGISQGSTFGPAWRTKINMVNSGFEERLIKWTSQRCEGVVLIENGNVEEFEEMLEWFYAMQGSGYGFRFKDGGDYKSCSISATPAFDDQTIGSGDGTTAAFQLVKRYSKGFTYVRDIKKPVSGTVTIGIGGVQSPSSAFNVNTTTGVVTLDNLSYTITNAFPSGGGTRLVTSNVHAITTGESIHLSGFTGDWAALNGTRKVTVLAVGTALDIDFDSSGFTTYSANGGIVKTLPQTGEAVTAGFEFDVPVRFDTDRMDVAYIDYLSFSFQLPIVELKL